MFKVIKDNKIIGVTENEPVLLDNYEVREDTERNVSDYIQIDGEFVLTFSAKAIEQKQAAVRAIRDKILDDFEWRISRNNDERELGIEETDERQSLLDYRQYLRDYTKRENWYELEPMKFDVWQAEQITEPEPSSQNDSSEEEYDTQIGQESPDDSSELEADMDAILGTKMQ